MTTTSDRIETLADRIPAAAQKAVRYARQRRLDASALREKTRQAIEDLTQKAKAHVEAGHRRNAKASEEHARRCAAAAAIALGESPPAAEAISVAEDSAAVEVDSLMSTAEIEEALHGLRERLQKAEAEIVAAQLAFRDACVQAIQAGARACAPHYAAAVSQLVHEKHLIDSADLALVAVFKGMPQRPHLTSAAWDNAVIPGSASFLLPEVSGRTTQTREGEVMYSAAAARERGVPLQLFRQLKDALSSEFGEWPFGEI